MCLVFLTELIAGISGFIFRHEVITADAAAVAALDSHMCIQTTNVTYYIDVDVFVYFQIKGTFLTTFSEAVKKYDGRDERSLAVDDVQRRVDLSPLNMCVWV